MRSRWLATAFAFAACNDLSIDGEVRFEGTHLTLHADPALPVCGDPAARADAYLDAIGAFLETPIPDIDYYLYDAQTVSCAVLGLAAAGCTVGETVRAITWIEYHELVHAVVDSTWGQPPALLVEGLAEGLAHDYPLLAPAQRASAPIDALLDSVRFHSGTGDEVLENYTTAGDFTVYLVRRFGPARFRRLYERLLFLGDAITFRLAFVDVMGVELDPVIADWRGEMIAAAPPLMPRATLRCAAPEIAPTAPDAFQIAEPLCASGVTANGAVLDQPATHVLPLALPGLYALRPRVTGSVFQATLTDCTSGRTALATASSSATAMTYLISADAGRHALELASLGAFDPPPSATFELARVGAESAACNAAPTFVANDARPWAIALENATDRWPGRVEDPLFGTLATSSLRVTLPAGGDLFALWRTSVAQQRATSVRICIGTCDAPAACTFVGGSPPATKITAPAGATLLLELRAPLGATPILELIAPR